MSENLSILDGELRRQFAPVDRLSVDNQGGGVSPWVVSDFLDISTLSVSENGLYLAAEEEYDCYEEVEVDISEELGEGDYRRITGKDPNLDPNNDYAAGLDENGNLTKEMIPAAIHIVVPPRKRKYEEGETIDFTGIHVYLMNGNNQRYTDDNYPTGEIPFDELIFPVTVAEGGSETTKTATSDLIDYPISFSSSGYTLSVGSGGGIYSGYDKQYHWTEYTDSAVCFFIYSTSRAYRVNASSAETNYSYVSRYKVEDENEDPSSIEWIDETQCGSSSHSQQFTYDGKTVFFSTGYSRGNYNEGGNSSVNPDNGKPEGFTTDDDKYIAWTMIYGVISGGEDSAIPVQWMRQDGKTLQDHFSITIGSEEPEPQPEPQPDPWGGYADVSYGGHHYNLNRRIVPEVHYANGYCWQEGTSEYTVEQAASMGWLILIR